MTVGPDLRRGVNLSHWYGQVYMEPGYVPEHFDRYMTDADLDLIARMGFDHVRFPLALERMLDGSGAGLDPDFTGRVAQATARLQERGIAVIVDLHPENEFKEVLAADETARARFVGLWERIADRFAALSAETTVFEILNEPSLGDDGTWIDLMLRSLERIRTITTEHAVVLSGDHYSEVPRLLALPPVDDPRVVYNFHLYDPISLTHQGAYWSHPWVQDTRGLDYPVEAANVAALREKATDPAATAELDDYERIGWNADVYADLVAPAVAFARDRGAPLLCNEFGVYREYVPRPGRLRWLRDVTGVFEAAGIGWTVWDYAGDFSVAVGEPGRREPDAGVVRALGLNDATLGSLT